MVTGPVGLRAGVSTALGAIDGIGTIGTILSPPARPAGSPWLGWGWGLQAVLRPHLAQCHEHLGHVVIAHQP